LKKQIQQETSVQAGGKLACWFFAEAIPSTLKMKAICSSETSVDTRRTTRCYIPEDGTIHNHRSENLKSYNVYFLLKPLSIIIHG
jgi:hypothetical protein